jgi:hypothetical protein
MIYQLSVHTMLTNAKKKIKNNLCGVQAPVDWICETSDLGLDNTRGM